MGRYEIKEISGIVPGGMRVVHGGTSVVRTGPLPACRAFGTRYQEVKARVD